MRLRALLLLAAGWSASATPQLYEFTVVIGAARKAFTVEVRPEWAPLGAARFAELVAEPGFFSGVRFFRTIAGFMTQFGIAGKPEVAARWKDRKIADDPVVESNARGFVSFATSGKDSRTTQMFINLHDNKNLDGMGFSPFARVVGDGMAVVDELYAGYGEGGAGDGSDGRGPSQQRVQTEGNKYLKAVFPKLSYIESVVALPAAEL